VHDVEVHDAVVAASRELLPDRAIAQALDLPRTTVRDIRRRSPPAVCPRCWQRTKPITATRGDYAELLALYLGDGHIVSVGRSERLRISLDARYPGIVADTLSLLGRCFPSNVVGRADREDGRCAVVSVNHLHLPCLLPQHAPGCRKHERPLTLEPWQRASVDAEPWRFLRGCIRSDGCVYVNRTGRYEYLSYDFSNRSSDLLDLFADTCATVGVACRRYGHNVRIYRRASVALMLEHVGVKT
jgi:hypothetical protein